MMSIKWFYFRQWASLSHNPAWMAAIIFTLISCTPEYSKGFHTSDDEYMANFVIELEKHNIPYKKEKDGMIRYKSRDRVTIGEIHKKIKEKLYSGITVKYKETKARDYFKKLLKGKNLDFYEMHKNGEIWIKWYPKSKQQQNEIEMEVTRYIFDLKAESK